MTSFTLEGEAIGKDKKPKKDDTDDERGRGRQGRSRTPRRHTNIPGFHGPLADEDFPGRAAGTFGIATPELRTEDVIKAMTEAFDNANRARTRRLARLRQQEKKDKKTKS